MQIQREWFLRIRYHMHWEGRNKHISEYSAEFDSGRLFHVSVISHSLEIYQIRHLSKLCTQCARERIIGN